MFVERKWNIFFVSADIVSTLLVNMHEE